MARQLCGRFSLLPLLRAAADSRLPKPQIPQRWVASFGSAAVGNWGKRSASGGHRIPSIQGAFALGANDFGTPARWRTSSLLRQSSRSYARDRSHYDLFGSDRRPGDEEFRKQWAEDVEEEDCLWTGSDEDEDDEKEKETNLKKEIKKMKVQAKENAALIDGDDSDELRSLCSESDEEVALWSGSECDDDDDIPTESHPNERSDRHIDKLFEFEETPKYRTLEQALKDEEEPPELSPGKQARKLAVENALKKLKRGPDGRYVNVWEVMTDIDMLIGAFDNIISGPEYAELRQGGPKKINMQFFKDIQTRMRDPNFMFSPELRLKPKSKFVPRKKWEKAQSRRRKAERR